MPWLNKAVEEDDEPTAEDIRARIEKLLRSDSAPPQDGPPPQANQTPAQEGGSTEAVASAAPSPEPSQEVGLKPSEQRWDLLTIDECAEKSRAAEDRKQEEADRPADEAGGPSEAEAVQPDPEPETMVHSFPSQPTERSQSGAAEHVVGGHDAVVAYSDGTAGALEADEQRAVPPVERRQPVRENVIPDHGERPTSAELEERIRDAVRPVLQEWASGELTRLIERVVKEEVAQLTSAHFENRQAKPAARVSG